MNRDEIIRMARDSGMELYGLGKDRERFVHHLQEFAALVAAASEAKERDACAKVCDKHGKVWGERMLLGFQATLDDAAKSIRARGQA